MFSLYICKWVRLDIRSANLKQVHFWQDLLTKHPDIVSNFLSAHYDEVCCLFSFDHFICILGYPSLLALNFTILNALILILSFASSSFFLKYIDLVPMLIKSDKIQGPDFQIDLYSAMKISTVLFYDIVSSPACLESKYRINLFLWVYLLLMRKLYPQSFLFLFLWLYFLFI